MVKNKSNSPCVVIPETISSIIRYNNSFSDYVYFETSSTSPYQIRRIEELNKTPSGNVEAKVLCFYRRRDLPNPLVQLADKHQSKYNLYQCSMYLIYG